MTEKLPNEPKKTAHGLIMNYLSHVPMNIRSFVESFNGYGEVTHARITITELVYILVECGANTRMQVVKQVYKESDTDRAHTLKQYPPKFLNHSESMQDLVADIRHACDLVAGPRGMQVRLGTRLKPFADLDSGDNPEEAA